MSTRRRFENLKVLLNAIETLREYSVIPPSILNAAQNVQEEFKDELSGDAINIVWSIADVSIDDDGTLTDDQYRDILAHIERKHDANIGINWDVIKVFVDEAKENNELESKNID